MDIIDKLSDFVMEEHPRAAAQVLAGWPGEDITGLFEDIPETTASLLLQHMQQQRAVDCLCQLDAHRAGSLIDAMSPEVASRILVVADQPTETSLLKHVRPAHARAIVMLSRLRKDTIGALMETTPPLTTDSTVSDARDYVTRTGYPYVYIVDETGRLAGVVNSSLLQQEQEARKLSGLMTPNVECLNHQTPTAAVRNHPVWSHFDLVPVVDAQEKYVGVLRHKMIRKQVAPESDKSGIDAAIATFLDLSRMYWSASTHMILGPVPSKTNVARRGTHDE